MCSFLISLSEKAAEDRKLGNTTTTSTRKRGSRASGKISNDEPTDASVEAMHELPTIKPIRRRRKQWRLFRNVRRNHNRVRNWTLAAANSVAGNNETVSQDLGYDSPADVTSPRVVLENAETGDVIDRLDQVYTQNIFIISQWFSYVHDMPHLKALSKGEKKLRCARFLVWFYFLLQQSSFGDTESIISDVTVTSSQDDIPPEVRRMNVRMAIGETVLHRMARLGYEVISMFCIELKCFGFRINGICNRKIVIKKSRFSQNGFKYHGDLASTVLISPRWWQTKSVSATNGELNYILQKLRSEWPWH